MRKLFALLGAVALLSLPLAAAAQSDTGTHLPDSGTVGWDAGLDGPCPTGLTYQGECHGSINRWCDPDTSTVSGGDCAEYSSQVGNAVTCGLVDCTTSECYGYGCISGTGGYCDGQYVLCASDQGCLNLGSEGGTCGASAACVDTETSPYASTCTGQVLGVCVLGRVWTMDCSEGGNQPYICGEGTEGNACLGTAGGTCNMTEGYECAPGFRCNSNSGNGTCVAATDAGRRDTGVRRDTGTAGGTDSATGDGDDGGGGVCGCSGVNAGASALAVVVAMLGLALIRRRR